MSSSYLFIFCLLGIQLAGQVMSAPSWFCDVDGGSIGCIKEHNMNGERYEEDRTSDGLIVYTLEVEDLADPSPTFSYEILPTDPLNIPAGGADGIEYLSIDINTGDVRFHTPVDYEVFTELRPTWRVTNTNGGSDPLVTSVIVFIDNVNDLAPEFINEPYVANPIPEDTTVGITVFSSVAAIDDDSEEDSSNIVDGPIIFSLLDTYESYDCDPTTFRVNETTGDIILNDNVTYLGKTQYTVCIEANDQGTFRVPLASQTTIRLSISDVQGESPNFIGVPYRVSIPEDTPVGSTIFENIYAQDGDTGVPNPNDVFITLLDGGFGRFRIDSSFANEGSLIIAQELDREVNDSYTLLIQAKEDDVSQPDDATTSTTFIDVIVLDANDEPPVFSNQPDAVYLQENSPVNTPLNLGVTVSDADTAPNAVFTLSLVGAGDAFKLQQTVIFGVGTVDVRVNRNDLDYETTEGFNFTVVASEVGHPDASFNVTVILLDVNDNSPKFENDVYECSILENSPENTPVCQVLATDDDSPEYANITYSLEGSGSDRFTIDLLEAYVSVAADAKLDAETQDIFFLTVLADDGDRIGTTLLQINLDDVNDVNPEFNLGPTEELIVIQEFNEVDRIGDRLVVVTASDGDVLEVNKDVIYYISDGNDASKFAIDEFTGEITLSDTIDYETDSQEYNITVVAQNTADPPLEGSAVVTVIIADINDNAPIFEYNTYYVNVSEDATVGELVIAVTATDIDKPGDPNSVIDYRIISGSQDQFRIEVSTGRILVNDILDREAVDGAYYVLDVVATDRGIVQLEGNCQVLVNITDVNDVAPIFDPVEPQTVSEDHTTGESSVFYTVTAFDPDVSADLRYLIDTDNIQAFDEDGVELDPTDFMFQFGVVETTGGLFLNESLDREVAATFVLSLLVRDYNADNPSVHPQDDEVSLSITVLDVNDNTPVFMNTPYVFDVDEHEVFDAVISAEISATDPDLGSSGTVQYTKESGSGYYYVQINLETGVLTVDGDFNREEYATLEVLIRASDLGTPQNYNEAMVTLNIADINDNPPEFNSTIPTEIEIYEDIEIGTKVLKVTATDLDVDHGEIMYTITAGNVEQKFDISDNKTGVITTKNNFDRETTAVYILQITASDKAAGESPQQDVIEVTINILDVNDMVPEIASPEFNTGVEVVETVVVGTTILFVAAEDGDEDLTPNSEISFLIGGGTGQALFGIDPDSGEISTLIPLTTLSAVYDLIVVVHDHGVPPLESNRTLTVEVLDVNDDDPIILFPEQDDIVYLPENYNGYVLLIDAIDNDKGNNGLITYEFVIIPETPEDYKSFTLNNETGELTINEVTDRETQESYRLFIQAANRLSDDLRTSPTVSFTVTVNDTNDNSPVFRKPDEDPVPLPLTVGENLLTGSPVGYVNVSTDADGPGNDIIFYFIVDGNEGNWFFLDKNTGLLRIQESLDREERRTYILIIKASSNETYLPVVSDDALPSLLDPSDDPTLKEVVIEIIDENDNPPRFQDGPNNLFTAGVLNDYDVNDQVVQVTVTDADTDPANSKMAFEITKQQNCIPGREPECSDLNARNAFGIDENDTWIYTIRKFESSEQGYYQLDVVVTDPTKTEFFDTTLVDIYLITEKQQVRIDFAVPTDEVLAFNVAFRELYASIIEEHEEYTNVAVNLDDIQVYTDDTTDPITVIDNWTYMIAHAVDLDTNRVIPASVIQSAIDQATDDQKDEFRGGYSVLEVNLVYTPPEVIDLTLLQWIFLALALIFLFLFVVVMIAFVFTRSDYRRKLRAATAGMMGTSKPIQQTLVPGTNKFAAEASNPVFNEKQPPQYEEMDTESTDEGESAGGSESQEFTVDMYNDENDQSKLDPREAADSNKLLMAVLDELENSKHGIDNIDVTDV